ncbi:MAG TPA: prepilin-type cleavage/methylation domain-containing protein [Verrucomicrobiae bacterium]
MKRFFRQGVFIVVAVGFILFVFISGWNFYEARNTPASNSCINNLRQLDGATQQWGLENQKAPTNTPSWSELKPYLGRGSAGSLDQFHCSQDPAKTASTSYLLGSATVPPRCRIDPSHKLN